MTSKGFRLLGSHPRKGIRGSANQHQHRAGFGRWEVAFAWPFALFASALCVLEGGGLLGLFISVVLVVFTQATICMGSVDRTIVFAGERWSLVPHSCPEAVCHELSMHSARCWHGCRPSVSRYEVV